VGLLYTFLVGIPMCMCLVALGLFLCVTIIGIPAGLTAIALGFRYLALPNRHWL
jgi:uncharacterized membrane protein YccF (DUF307 family)